METTRRENIWWNNVLINILYYPIKTLSFSNMDYKNNIIGAYAPYNLSGIRIKEFLMSKMNEGLDNDNKFEYSFQPCSRLEDGEFFHILGKRHSVKIYKSDHNDLLVDESNCNIYILNKNKSCFRLIDEMAIKILTPVLHNFLHLWMSKMGLNNIQLYVTNQMRACGSCEYDDNKIYINTSMLEFPEQCLELLIVHELCHFFVHDHGQKFYKTMDKFFPSWRAADWSYENHSIRIGPRG